jgi:hypothetical protein
MARGSMDVILLPMVDEDLSLKSAFAMMRMAHRSGIVWRKDPAEFLLFSAIDIAFAGAAKTLSQLTGEAISVVDITQIAQSTSEYYLDSARLYSALEKPSVSAATRYGLLAAGEIQQNPLAVLYSKSSEDVLYLEPEPGDCYCAGPPRHKIDCKGGCPLHPASMRVRVMF